MPTTTLKTVCVDAMLEINQIAAGDVPGPDDVDFVYRKALRIFDRWNASRQTMYADQFQIFALTPSLSPHTIGSGGSFNTPQRPVSLEGANLIYGTSGNPRIPIEVRDAAWWLSKSLKSMSDSVPTDVYYEPDWPLGKLFFWPIPTAAVQVELWTRQVFSALGLEATFSFPPGYQDAITLTLAEAIAGPFGKQVKPDLERAARLARATIFSNNVAPPKLQTRDSGLPGGGGSSGSYLTGWQ